MRNKTIDNLSTYTKDGLYHANVGTYLFDIQLLEEVDRTYETWRVFVVSSPQAQELLGRTFVFNMNTEQFRRIE